MTSRILPLVLLSATVAMAAPMKFDFGSQKAGPGFTAVTPLDTFGPEKGYGFDLGFTPKAEDRGGDPVKGDFVTGEGGFYFSVALPPGNYEVTLLLGDPAGESDTTVKAESRRLMLEHVMTAEQEQVTRKFTVNIRQPEYAGGRVGLKDREKAYLHWDNKLTLEFNGPRPCVAAVEITPAPEATTVWLLGDSTVTDQPFEPWNSWGQMFTRFFKPGVAVANHAESGESLGSSLSARRVAKVLAELKKGDCVFIQFGHNDMKSKKPDALATYEENLGKLVRDIQAKGGVPVLVTSMERKGGVVNDTLAGYPDAVRRVAAKEKAQLIDLHAMSRQLYVGLGKNLGAAFQDGTHHNNFGSYEIARCVVEGVRRSSLPLAAMLSDDVKPFDPSKPDAVADFKYAISPLKDLRKPDGN
ncbi:MAG: rhamnogalacturonan acetylesterase [Verrucomicrobiaceae bacterium]|nr:MAG: rhamnogalacturonan acetylesterase [Verrucomicrobiaceae bacterium]